MTVREASKSVKKGKNWYLLHPWYRAIKRSKNSKQVSQILRVGYDASDIERALPDLDKLSNFGLELQLI